MSACIVSTLVSHLIQHGSLFTEPLRRKGILLPENLAPSWLNQPRVEEYMVPEVETIGAAARFDAVVDKFLKTPLEQERLYVVDRDGRYLGAISLHEIKLFIRESQNLDPVIAIDVMDPTFPCCFSPDPLSRAVEILSENDAERLPVLDGPEGRKLVGTISKRQLLTSYRMTNLARIQVE
jgi:CIC family chloride channel protein